MSTHWKNLGNFNCEDEKLRMIAFKRGWPKYNTFYGVDWQGRYVAYDHKKEDWVDQGLDMDLRMVAFDKNNVLYCVKTDGTIWYQNTDGEMVEFIQDPIWDIQMIAFDMNNDGAMWCVRHDDGYVAQWDDDNNIWKDEQKLGNWFLIWLFFDPKDTSDDEVYCVGQANNLGKYEFDNNINNTMLNVTQNWALLSLTSRPDGYFCTGKEGNIGYSEGI